MTLFDGPLTQKRCFVYCGDDRCDCECGPRGKALRGIIDFPAIPQDQRDFLRAAQEAQDAASDYDPDMLVRGRKPPSGSGPCG